MHSCCNPISITILRVRYNSYCNTLYSNAFAFKIQMKLLYFTMNELNRKTQVELKININ